MLTTFKNISLLLIVSLLMSFSSFAKVSSKTRIEALAENSSSDRIILSIVLDRSPKELPELTLKKNIVQLTFSDTEVWPKIEKKIEVQKPFDTLFTAYQYNSQNVRVRTYLPFNVEKLKNKVFVTVEGDKVLVQFPRQKIVPQMVSSVKNPLPKKGGKINNKYLTSLLNDIDQVETPVLKKPVAAKKKSIPLKVTQDEVKSQKAAVTKAPAQKKPESKGFEFSGYIWKFIGFFALIIGGFIGVVTLFRKGILNKSKLNFLKDTELVSVINTTYLAPKRSLILVKVYDQILLLGNSESGIAYLSSVDNLEGVLKEGEKIATGKNFEGDLVKAFAGGQTTDIKEKVDIKKSHNSKLSKFLSNSKESKKVKDEIKNKVKNLRPLQ